MGQNEIMSISAKPILALSCGALLIHMTLAASLPLGATCRMNVPVSKDNSKTRKFFLILQPSKIVLQSHVVTHESYSEVATTFNLEPDKEFVLVPTHDIKLMPPGPGCVYYLVKTELLKLFDADQTKIADNKQWGFRVRMGKTNASWTVVQPDTPNPTSFDLAKMRAHAKHADAIVKRQQRHAQQHHERQLSKLPAITTDAALGQVLQKIKEDPPSLKFNDAPTEFPDCKG